MKLSEIAPMPMPGAAPAPGAKSMAVGGQAIGGVDPKQAAMMIKQKNDQKKQLQDAIKAKQGELQALQKQLADLG